MVAERSEANHRLPRPNVLARRPACQDTSHLSQGLRRFAAQPWLICMHPFVLQIHFFREQFQLVHAVYS